MAAGRLRWKQASERYSSRHVSGAAAGSAATPVLVLVHRYIDGCQYFVLVHPWRGNLAGSSLRILLTITHSLAFVHHNSSTSALALAGHPCSAPLTALWFFIALQPGSLFLSALSPLCPASFRPSHPNGVEGLEHQSLTTPTQSNTKLRLSIHPARAISILVDATGTATVGIHTASLTPSFLPR